MSKQTDLINIPDAITVSGSNVGVGTSNPSTMLHLSAGTTNGQGGSEAGITMTNKYDNPDNSWSIKPAIQGVSNTGLEIRDVTDNRSVMVFDGSGYVTTPSQPSFLAGMSALQSLVHATMTKVQFNQSVEQTGSNFSTSNYRFTCPVAGRYLFNWHVYVYSVKNMESKLYKNGSSLIRIASPVAYQDENPHGGGGSAIVEANANDYFEIYAAGYHSSGGGSSVYPGSGAERASSFSGMLIG
jgi:hypothetical protein